MIEESPIHRGKFAEEAAFKYLKGQGLKAIAKNYSCKCGEIDLIMRDEDTLVFVEVRLRKSQSYGDGAASVTQSKQHRIILAAQWYLKINRFSDPPCRFDVVSVGFKAQQVEISWIRDAFWVQY